MGARKAVSMKTRRIVTMTDLRNCQIARRIIMKTEAILAREMENTVDRKNSQLGSALKK